MMEPNHCLLVLSNRRKSIPYGDGQRAFVPPLKGRPAAAAQAIREVQDFEPLQTAVVRLNDATTSFFTVGCEKAFNQADSGYWAKGYLEFSINDAALAQNVGHYFKLFFDFNQYLWGQAFSERVQYGWELEGAEFLESGTIGWTGTVWITTADVQTVEQSRAVFSAALTTLVTFLAEHRLPIEQPIY